MSIVRLSKVTLYGPGRDKARVIAGLQDLGCLHLLPLAQPEPGTAEGLPSAAAREALRFLQDCPQKRRQMHPDENFDPVALQEEALAVSIRMAELHDEIDLLRARIDELKPWGNFNLLPVEDRGGYFLWFYKVPHHKVKRLFEQEDLVFEEVHHDQRFAYIAVISKEEPGPGVIPVERTHTGKIPLADLERRLEHLEGDLEDQRVERFKLSRWATAFAGSLASLEDNVARHDASQRAYEDSGVFAIQGWVPQHRLQGFRAFAGEHGLAFESIPPGDEETPPTLLENPPSIAAGENLVTFYVTPNYHRWDPSTVVFVSFTIFFAMILGDALVLAAILGLFRKRMATSEIGLRMRRLLSSIVVASIVWGILVGSYFGVTPPPDSWLGRLKLLDVNNFEIMMPLSILVGVIHILLANIVEMRRLRGTPQFFVPLGWMSAILGGVVVWLGSLTSVEPVTTAGWILIAGGLGAVFFTSKTDGSIIRRIFGGFAGLTRITGAFGDILSYLRLFALGLASSALALSFNDLAHQASGAAGGFGFLLAGLILLAGHLLNFLLCIMSGVVHGLRLNFIEFFNWSLDEEGSPFRPFHRKEHTVWTNSSSP